MSVGIYGSFDDLKVEDALLNRGLFFGESPFTTMYLENGKIHGLSLHLHRIKACVEYLFNVDFSTYEKKVLKLIAESTKEDGKFYLRLTFTKLLNGKIEFFLYKDIYKELNTEINLKLSKVIKGKSFLPNFLKVGNYIEYTKELSERSDCNELLYKNFEGNILESGVSNIFLIKENVVYTPAIISGVLDGVMRQLLIQFLAKENIAFKEANIDEKFLSTCDEIWLTNGLRGVRVVNKYNEINLSNEIWTNLKNQFNEFVNEYE